MRKKILFCTIFTLFPTLCWAIFCDGGKHPGCPKDRPFLSEEGYLDYFYVPRAGSLAELNSLKDLLEIPDFPQEEACFKTKDPACKKLEEVKQYQQKIKEEQQKLLQENEEIRQKNNLILMRDEIAYKRDQLYEVYRNMVKIDRCRNDMWGNLLFVKDKVITGEKTFSYPNPSNPLQEAINSYLEEVNEIISKNLHRQELNKEIRQENLKAEKENFQIEQKNFEIEKQFREYYTPEKTQQLIKEYKKVLAERCVGCDYPKPLSIFEDSCKECPNRAYVDGKCVLKNDSKKGATK